MQKHHTIWIVWSEVKTNSNSDIHSACEYKIGTNRRKGERHNIVNLFNTTPTETGKLIFQPWQTKLAVAFGQI